MKRILSVILVFAMLAAMFCIPTTAWTAPATYTNTSALFDTDASTLYAVKGTPTIDGTVDASWANAYTLRLDRSQLALMGGNYPQSTMVDIYMMWDENNLYILEDHNYATPKYNAGATNFWGSSSNTCFYLSLPTDYTDDSINNDGAVNMVNVLVGDTTSADVAAGRATQRTKYYTNNAGAQGDITWAAQNAVTTYTNKVSATSYVQETAIPWSILDDYTPDFAVAKDTVIGLIVHIKQNYGSNGMHKKSTDANGFQQLKLVEGTNPTVKPIMPDFSWWNNTDKTFTINSEAQLLGLVEIAQRHGSSTFATALGITGTINFAGYTFNLGKDLTFNEGTTFNADGTWTGVAPVNGWGTINDFYGTFNGNGHTISGMYVPYGYKTGADVRYVGLFGRISGPTKVTNLNLTNGYMSVDTSSTNQSAGSIAAVLHHNGGAGTMTIQNVTSDLHLRGTEFAGGILGSTYSTAAIVLNVSNVTFTGTASGGTFGAYAGRDGWSTYVTGTVTDFYGPANLKNTGSHYDTVTYANSKAPVVQKTEAVDDCFNLRILGGIDSLDYKNVGFKVTVSHVDGTSVTKTYDTTQVYTAVLAAGNTVQATTLGSQYIYALVIENIPTDAIAQITVTPYRTTMNGVSAYSSVSYQVIYKEGAVDNSANLWETFTPSFSTSNPTQTYSADSSSKVQQYAYATKAQFDAYISRLEDMGFTISHRNQLGNNHYALATGTYSTVHVSFIATQSIMRVYTEEAGLNNYPADANPTANSYEPKMWQLRVDNITSRQNGGMSYVWLLADGTFFILDGGYQTTAEADNLYNFLVEKNPLGGKPVISAWYFSHGHGDHIGAVKAFASKYASNVDVKAFYYHLDNGYDAAFNTALAKWPNAECYGRLHTGMKVNLPGLSFNVMYTVEDLYQTGYTAPNYNSQSSVIRVDVEGQKVMFLGDIQRVASDRIELYHNSAALKSDIVQFSHHGYEGATKTLYDKIAAPTVLWPINLVSTQKDGYTGICNVFTKWGMHTHTAGTEGDMPNYYITHSATYCKQIIVAGTSAYQELNFPYTATPYNVNWASTGGRLPNIGTLYTQLKPVLVPDESLYTW